DDFMTYHCFVDVALFASLIFYIAKHAELRSKYMKNFGVFIMFRTASAIGIMVFDANVYFGCTKELTLTAWFGNFFY
ncbi:hypothetical protein PFISCL1PPCAC_3166, partial [Pristionchus fissidentatus]